jgi:hypothetical protein
MRFTASGISPMVKTRTVGPAVTAAKEATEGTSSGKGMAWAPLGPCSSPLDQPAHVRVEAWWGTSFTPPEPTSTSMLMWDNHLDSGAAADDEDALRQVGGVHGISFVSGSETGRGVRLVGHGLGVLSVVGLLPGVGGEHRDGRRGGGEPSSGLSSETNVARMWGRDGADDR